MIITSINQFCHKHGRIAGAFILLVMAIPFVFYGYFTGKDPRQGELIKSVGTVFGEDVPYKKMAETYRNMTGRTLGTNPKSEKWFLNYMMKNEAVLMEAKSKNLGDVSKENIVKELAKNPRFSTDGKFDYDKYKSQANGSEAMIEQQTMNMIITERLRNRISEEAAAKVTDQQIREAYDKQNVKFTIQAATYKNSDFLKNVNATDEEVVKYYQDNKEEFRIPEKKVVNYVKFSGPDVEDTLVIPEDKLKEQFEANEKKYIEVKASHILIKLDPKGTDEDKAAKRKEIEEIAAKIKAGEKFEDLAKAKSACPSGQKGGDLGWFKKGQMDAAFEKKSFSLKKGEISDIVESSFGFHIIRLDDEHKTLESVRSKVEDDIKATELPKLAGRAADDFATKVYDAIEAPKNKGKSAVELFAAIAEKNGKTVTTTEAFETNATSVKGITSRKFASDMKDVTAATPLSEAVAGNGSNYYVACFVEKINSYVPEFDKLEASAKATITGKIKNDKSQKMAKARAEKALADAKRAVESGKAFQDVAKSLKFVDIKEFKAKETPTGLAGNIEVKSELKDKKVGEFVGPVEGPTGYDVVYIKAITQPTDEEFTKDKETITNTVKDGAKSDAWMEAHKEIIERAQITMAEPWAEPKAEDTAKDAE